MLCACQQRANRAAVAKQRLASDAGGAEAGAVKRIPEAQRLEAPGGEAGQLDRYLDRIRAAGREKHFSGLAAQRLKARTQRLGQFNSTLAGKTARCKGQGVELALDGRDDVRVRIADMVHIVAMEVHVASAAHVLDPDALGPGDRTQAGRGNRLMQESGAVARQQVTRVLVQVLRLPLAPARRLVDIALAL